MPRPLLNDLYDLLACPVCRSPVHRRATDLACAGCARRYPIVDGVPVLLPPRIAPLPPDAALPPRGGYDEWIHRAVLDSLPADAVALEIGAGHMAESRPNVLRMDVTLTPYVDLVGDVHAMPIRDEHLDFVFALAVFEHLRQPFQAAQEIHRTLRNGGYLYAECSFLFPFHGHPSHYFNASHQGMAELFRDLTCLRSGVAPHQMPSFAVRALLETYLFFLSPHADPEAQSVAEQLRAVLARDLEGLNARFSQEAACRVAACTYVFAVKAPERSEVVPAPILHAYRRDAGLQARYPNPLDIGQADNLLRWARSPEARGAAALDRVVPFRKDASPAPAPRAARPWAVPGMRQALDAGARLRRRVRRAAAAAWTVEQIIDDGERVTHLFPNDCFVAHRSIYHFLLPEVAGAAVLDAGCGAGYGAAYLADHGARLVAGVDASPNAIAFSREHFVRPNLRYEVMNLENLEDLEAVAWDVVICSNVLEHVPRVGRFLRRVGALLAPGGVLLVAVPPIVSDALRSQNLANPYHLNIWSPRQWGHALGRYFGEVQAYRHWYDKPGIELNLINSPADTVITEPDFVFQAVDVDTLYTQPTITAVFAARRPVPVATAAALGSEIELVDESFTRPPPAGEPGWAGRTRRALGQVRARVRATLRLPDAELG